MKDGVLQPGATLEFGYRVERRHLASALDGGEGGLFPDVYSTAFLVGLMEACCSRLLAQALDSDEMSVGGGLQQVSHLAPTPEGAQVRAIARLERVEGKFWHFTIQAFDDLGLIGEAVHRRAVVKTADFHARAGKRRPVAS